MKYAVINVETNEWLFESDDLSAVKRFRRSCKERTCLVEVLWAEDE